MSRFSYTEVGNDISAAKYSKNLKWDSAASASEISGDESGTEVMMMTGKGGGTYDIHSGGL